MELYTESVLEKFQNLMRREEKRREETKHKSSAFMYPFPILKWSPLIVGCLSV